MMSLSLKKRGFGLVSFIVSFLLLSGLLFSHSAQARMVEFRGQQLDIAMPGETIPGQIIVVLKSRSAEKDLNILAKKLGAKILRKIEQANMYLLEFPSDPIALSALDKFKEFPSQFSAYPNYKFSIPAPPEVAEKLLAEGLGIDRSDIKDQKFLPLEGIGSQEYTTNDPGVSNQYWLYKIKEPFTPDPPTASHHIAIIDTGVDYFHPELTGGKVVSVWDYVDWDSDAMDENGHGTHCAGIAAAYANNNQGIRGVSPLTKIYAYRVLNKWGSGSFFDVTEAIYDAADNPDVKILSLSLGGYLEEGSAPYDDQQAAVDYAVSKGKIVCVAAGNEGNVYLYYYAYYGYNYRPVPAWYPNSFTVGATNEEDFRVYFSNYDVKDLESADGTATYNWNFVDIVAPGWMILSTYLDDQYEMLSGTSMSCPMVAGAAARLWDHFSGWSNTDVMNRLVNTGRYVAAWAGFPVYERRLNLSKAIGVTAYTGFQGRILHGEKGYPLEYVKIEAISGGTVEETAYTNRAGIFTLKNLDAAKAYTLRASRSGFVTRVWMPKWGSLAAGHPPDKYIGDIFAQPIVPSRPTTADDENWRIMVYWMSTQPGYYYWNYDYDIWGDYLWYPFHYYNAAGLEANAYLRDPDGYTYCWYYEGALGTSPYVKFMHDSWSDTPVECHVIQRQKTGTYTYWLTASPDDWGWGTMKYSPGSPYYPNKPVVIVYKGDTPKAIINSASATQVGSGTMYWHVFDLNGDTITIVNEIQDTVP